MTRETGNARRIRIVQAFEAAEINRQTLTAVRGNTIVGWKKAFLWDSGGKVCLITEAKAKGDGMPINSERTNHLDLTGDKL